MTISTHDARTAEYTTGRHLDVRLYPQTPDVVIVWAAGTVNGRTVQLLALRTIQQLIRADHVIVDLSAAHIPPTNYLAVGDVLELIAQKAQAVHTRLHIAGLAQEHFERQLRDRGLDHIHVGPSAAVIATLVHQGRLRTR